MTRVGLTTQRLTVAGADLADEVGFDRVTVAELARRFGVRAASLYSHVRGSADLRTRISLLALAELADLATDALAGRSRADALSALAEVYRDYARHHPGRYAAARTRLAPTVAADSAGPRHTRLILAILHGYDLPEAQRGHAVRLLGSVIHGYLSLEHSGAFDHSAPDARQSWTRILQVLDATLRHWPA